MKKSMLLTALLPLVLFIAWCTSEAPIITTQEIDVAQLKEEIKKEVLTEIKEELTNDVNKEVEELKEAVEDIEDEVENVEDNIEDLEIDQQDLETLLDLSTIEITTQWENNAWNFTTNGDTLIRSAYPTTTIAPNTAYTVLIEQETSAYTITNERFDILLTLQQCSFNENWEIYAYVVDITDASNDTFNGCANVKL